ncbi:hypothetical protein [Mucilaginibacter sp.]|uniref:hypothetical protein n=1 Tax=Mucilaginibacter sp. TaxID=1882438 RepID=UPI0035BC36AE
MKRFIYRHIQSFGLIGMMLISMVSCRRGSTTVIRTSDDNNSQTIEYSGRVVFSRDQRSIDNISKDGHVKFERNGKKVEAVSGKTGRVVYEFDGDSPVSNLSTDQKQFVAEAVQTIIRERKKLQARKN